VASSNKYCPSCAPLNSALPGSRFMTFVASRADTCKRYFIQHRSKFPAVSLGALALKLVVDEDAELLPKISGRIARRKPATVGRSTGPRPQTPPQLVPSTVVVPAMTMKVIVNPTCSGTIRRPPEWVPPDPTDNTTDHQANRPGDHQARTSAEGRSNCIRLRAGWSNGDHED
jgi:hypothetical protein